MRYCLVFSFALLAASALGGLLGVDQTPFTLAKGDTAPDFTAQTITGEDIHLGSLVKKGNVVLLFYQGFWCTGCHKSLSHFREELAKITEKGGHTIAITPTPLSGKPKPTGRTDENVSIIIDTDLSIMRSYGVVEEASSEYIRGNQSFKTADFSFIPATFIVDENQLIKFAHVDASFTINAFVDSLLIHP